MEDDTGATFKKLLKNISKHLDSKSVNDDLSPLAQALFDQWDQMQGLPQEFTNSQIDSFISTIIALVWSCRDKSDACRAVGIFLVFLKEDDRVFARFKPTRVILKKMKLERLLSSKNYDESNKALDFCSFILRYNSDINYNDFSDESEVTDKIKRGESFRSWGDIEDLGNTHEALAKNFNEHEKTVGNAFQELYNHIEKVKEHLSGQIKENKDETIRLNNAIDRIRDQGHSYQPATTTDHDKTIKRNIGEDSKMDSKLDEIEIFINDKVIKRVELIEQHEDEFTEKLNTVINKVKIQLEKSAKVEEQLKEHLDIISTVNKKTNNNHKTFEEVKKLIHNKVSRVEQLVINKEQEDIPTYSDMKVAYEKIK